MTGCSCHESGQSHDRTPVREVPEPTATHNGLRPTDHHRRPAGRLRSQPDRHSARPASAPRRGRTVAPVSWLTANHRDLVPFLRDDGLDVPFAQVSTVAAGGVGLVAGDCVGPGAGRPAGPRTRTFLSTGMNCGLSAACPSVRTMDSGRHFRSAASAKHRTPGASPATGCPSETARSHPRTAGAAARHTDRTHRSTGTAR